jgi:Tol biopolymer transport system component
MDAAAPWAVVVLMATVLFVTQIGRQREGLQALPIVKLELNMPAGVEVSTSNTPNVSISPDGRLVAFIGGLGGLRRLYVRRFDDFEATPLRGTETANQCFFSPDGSALAFITNARVLKKVSLADGLVTTVVGEADYAGGGGAWGPDDRITFARGGTLWQVPATGGPARQLTTLDSGKNERLHAYPTVVAGGKAILFESVTGGDRTATHIEALSLTTGQRRGVIDAGSSPVYASSGHVIFFRDGVLLAAPFDTDKLEVTGPAVVVLENISVDQLGNPMVALSSAGSLAYVSSGNATKRLVWVSRQGVEQPITDISRPYQNPRLAPDAHRIVVEVAGGDLWMQDATRATFTRLTSGETVGNTFAVWTPDARRIVFRTLTGLRWIDPDGGGGSKAIPGTSVANIPSSISPDGHTLAFIGQHAESGGDIYALSLDGDPQPRPVVKTSGYDGGAQFSPDGHWMAYVSNESGSFEVYVRPYPGPDRKLPVSTQGGTHPKWNRNGKELFYRVGNKMMVVDLSTSPDLTLSQPRVLFEQRYDFGSQTIPNYDVSPDGQRFVMVKDDSASGRLNIVLNWFEELRRLAPVAGK